MTQTEWIISLDDDLKDSDELFVGNVRDGEKLIRCKDCKYYEEHDAQIGSCSLTETEAQPYGYCWWAERESE